MPVVISLCYNVLPRMLTGRGTEGNAEWRGEKRAAAATCVAAAANYKVYAELVSPCANITGIFMLKQSSERIGACCGIAIGNGIALHYTADNQTYSISL